MMRESKVGSAAYARELAAPLKASLAEPGDGTCSGITDTEICIAALRAHAGRHVRRLALAAGGLVLAPVGAAPWFVGA